MSWPWSKPVDPGVTAAQLRQTLDGLHGRERGLRESIVQEQNSARDYASRDKNLALYHMRRKKMFEEQLGRVQGSVMALEKQLAGLEDATLTKEAVDSMRLANQSIKGVHRTINIDSVDDTLDDMDDLLAEQASVADRISSSVPALDEDELLDELEDLVVSADTSATSSLPTPAMPAVPQSQPAARRDLSGLDML